MKRKKLPASWCVYRYKYGTYSRYSPFSSKDITMNSVLLSKNKGLKRVANKRKRHWTKPQWRQKQHRVKEIREKQETVKHLSKYLTHFLLQSIPPHSLSPSDKSLLSFRFQRHRRSIYCHPMTNIHTAGSKTRENEVP